MDILLLICEEVSFMRVRNFITHTESSWQRKLYWNNDVFKSCTNFDHIKTHYYWSHKQVGILHSLALDRR